MKILTVRKWENVTIKVKDEKGFIIERPVEMSTQFFIRQCLDNVGDGINVSEMAKRIKIFEKLSKLKPGAKTIELEDDEFLTLMESEAKVKWSFIHNCFVAFHDDIVNAHKK